MFKVGDIFEVLHDSLPTRAGLIFEIVKIHDEYVECFIHKRPAEYTTVPAIPYYEKTKDLIEKNKHNKTIFIFLTNSSYTQACNGLKNTHGVVLRTIKDKYNELYKMFNQ